ncbi:MAG TPA: hemerythrin domain-containing protein, partial [Polyangiaceae bacterium]|nr:hemerythrin domain-containing protein [Polyangiaceae bacterium]
MNREVRLRGLSSDHHRSLVLVRHIRETLSQGGSESDLCAHVAGHYDAELEPHFRAEEELLLPQLTSETNRSLAERTFLEHRLLRSQIAAGVAGQLDALRA